MIKSTEEANKYYELVNRFVDEYIEKWKITPSRLGNYLKNNSKLSNFLERNGIKDIKNINIVLNDVINDRIGMEKDMVLKFEGFKMLESMEFTMVDLRGCLYKGIGNATVKHEKIIADYFDVSLSHINIIDSEKHIFEIETINNNIECVIYTSEELQSIRENIKEFCLNHVSKQILKLKTIGVDIDINVKEFINIDKFYLHLDSLLTIEKIKVSIKNLVSVDMDKDSNKEGNNLIGINPSNY